jgi:hypothetical protein
MTAAHLEILVEEPSMEAFLRELLPRLLGEEVSFSVYPHQCKDELLNKLPQRLMGYATWLPPDWRIVVIVDRDDDDCKLLKARLEKMASNAGLLTRSDCAGGESWQVANRIAVEELEAWYFGEWNTVLGAYPRVSAAVPGKASYRDPDAISGGTWEALERVLKRAGYFQSGLRKVELARELGRQMNWESNRSGSFCVFRDTLLEAVT